MTTSSKFGVRYLPAVLVGRIVRTLARLRKPGGGSAIPGVVVNRLAPQYLHNTLSAFGNGLVIVSGSAGKSTTTKMLVDILRAHGLTVFTNPSTANIRQGLTSALLEEANLRGQVTADIAVLEMDEGHGAVIAADLHPRVVALTNVLVDQIDRFHDSDMVANLLAKIASRATETVVTNADDGYLEALAEKLAGVPVQRFGVSDAVHQEHPRGLGYARPMKRDGSEDAVTSTAPSNVLVADIQGTHAVLTIAGKQHDIPLPARGVHYAVDAAAAVATARAVLGDRFSARIAVQAFDAMTPVFARGEQVVVRGQAIDFVLVQNPASFQLNLDSLGSSAQPLMVAIGSDVRDPSYFWPVDTSGLGRVDLVSGSKAEEAALQLVYDGVEIGRVEPDLARATEEFLALKTPDGATKTVVFSADSMRQVRRQLGLGK